MIVVRIGNGTDVFEMDAASFAVSAATPSLEQQAGNRSSTAFVDLIVDCQFFAAGLEEAAAAIMETPAQAARKAYRDWLGRRVRAESCRFARSPRRAMSQSRPPTACMPKIIVRKPQRSLPRVTR